MLNLDALQPVQDDACMDADRMLQQKRDKLAAFDKQCSKVSHTCWAVSFVLPVYATITTQIACRRTYSSVLSIALVYVQVAEGLYVSGKAVAESREILAENNITHVVNCVGALYPEHFKDDGITYKTLWLQGTDLNATLLLLALYMHEQLT